MNSVVVGYGSIGARHARLLAELGCRVAVVSRREVTDAPAYRDLREALEREQPRYVVVANATNEHRGTVQMLDEAGYGGTVLVEKPLAERSGDWPAAASPRVFVAYNLRFHPLIQRLKAFLADERAISVHAYAGQYLPEWRPGTDYRASYSANAAAGGGVLRDLSHELDYLTWLLGDWRRVTALGGRLGELEITSDDVYSLELETARCRAIGLELNYLDRAGRRFLVVNTARHTVHVDFVAGTFTIDRETESVAVHRDESYRAMHRAVLDGDTRDVCSMEAGLEVVRLIEAAERGAREAQWVTR